MNDPYQSNIRGSKGRPINPARRAGIVSIRDQMDREDFSRKDRILARGIDNERGKTALRAGYTSGGSAPAPTNIGERQGLFSEMEKAGSAGITTGMRERARKLGVDDTSFNAAAGRIRTNEAFTPGAQAPMQGSALQPTPVSSPSAGTSPTALRQRVPRYQSSMVSVGHQQEEDAARGEETFVGASPSGEGWENVGVRSGKPVWSRKLESRAAARPGAKTTSDVPPAPQPVVAASAPVVEKPAQGTALRRSVTSPAIPPMAPAPARPGAALPSASPSSGLTKLPAMGSSMVPSLPQGSVTPLPQPKMRQTFLSDPAQDKKKEQAEIDARKVRERAGMEEAKRISNANRGVPEWAQPHRTKSPLKRGIGKLVRAMQYEW